MSETKVQTCRKHGDTIFVRRKTGFRCRKCSVDSVSKRRKELKQMAVAYKGGKCSVCGYDKCIAALGFHHIDPSEKDFGIATSGVTRSWEKLKVELDKCIIVCANCHAEVHHNEELDKC